MWKSGNVRSGTKKLEMAHPEVWIGSNERTCPPSWRNTPPESKLLWIRIPLIGCRPYSERVPQPPITKPRAELS